MILIKIIIPLTKILRFCNKELFNYKKKEILILNKRNSISMIDLKFYLKKLITIRILLI